MPLAFRVIARLDCKPPHLIKTVRLEGVRKIGDPNEYARRYEQAGIDELVYLDAVASLYGRNALAEMVSRATSEIFTPITVGGGIRSVEDARLLLKAGADKIAVNTAAVKRPELISELAQKFGSQAVVLQLDAKRKGDGWEAYCDGGREPTGQAAVEWAGEAEARGAGEILVTSIDREGTALGPDIALAERIARHSRVPVVYAGGVRSRADALGIAQTGVGAVAIAGALHFDHLTVQDCKVALRDAGYAVRETLDV